MLSAVYYPHQTLPDSGATSQRLLKRSLLLWDHLEFIVPNLDFQPVYADPLMARAMELIGRNHYPSEQEKKMAHERIEELVSRPSLPQLFYRAGHDEDAYNIYPEKLLPETWDILKRSGFRVAMGPQSPGTLRVGGSFISADQPSNEYEGYLSTTGLAGLAVLDILADCCAGTTRTRVTDRLSSYARLTGLLAEGASKTQVRDRLVDAALRAAPGHELLITLKLSILDVDRLDLEKLIEFRERESTETGHTLRDLRHNYLERIERQVQVATSTNATASDVEELERQFFEESKDDVAALQQELRAEVKEAILSKDVLVTILAAAGSLALAMFAQQFHVPSEFTWTGVPLTAGGIVSARDKFLKSRSDILRKHPMAFVLELGKR